MADQDGTSGDQGDGQGKPNGDTNPPANGPQDGAQGEQGGKPNGDADQGKPDPAEEWKGRARQHEDAAKTRKRERDEALAERDGLKGVLEGLRKALDPDSASKDASPEELIRVAAQERDAARGEVKLARVELAAERAARKSGADVDALLDSRAFLAKLGDLDPAADDFSAQVDAVVKAVIKDNPRLKAAGPPPPTPNADMSGGGGADGPPDIDTLRKQRAERRRG